MNKAYIEALGTAAAEIIQADPRRTNISAEDVAHQYYGDKIISEVVVKDVARHLKKMMVIIEFLLGDVKLVLVGKGYYIRPPGRKKSFAECLPTSPDEARKCLPLGPGGTPVGIHLPKNHEMDFIYKVESEIDGNRARGSMKRHVGRLEVGGRKGYLNEQDIQNGLKNSLEPFTSDWAKTKLSEPSK